MVSRLSTADAAFYHRENTSTPMYVGSLSILRRPRGGLSYDRLLEAVSDLSPAGATELGDHLFDQVSVFAEARRQADDQTLVILRGKVNDES